MRQFKQSLVRIGLGVLITAWISILIGWNSGFLWEFAVGKFVATIVLVGVMVFLTFKLIPAYVSWHKQVDPADADTSLRFDQKVGLAISHLRARARRLRLVSMYALALIVLVIISGIFMLQGEESLRVIRDPQRSNLLFEDKALLVEVIDVDERRLVALYKETNSADTGHFRELPSVEFPLIPDQVDTEEGRLTSCDDPCRATRIKVNKARLADTERRIENLLAVPNDARAVSAPPISSVVAKVTSAVLLLILVQLLISLYRYGTRLAAFYDSRADVLLLVGASSEADAHTLVAILMPDWLGFERVGVGPASEALETIKKAMFPAARRE